MTLEEALNEVRDLANRVGSDHMILGAALVLLVRCAPLGRTVQHRLLTAGAALVEVAEMKENSHERKR